MPPGHNRHQLSLEVILDFSQPFVLPHEQSRTASNIFGRLIDHYDPKQTSQKGYKPAALAQAVFDHVSSKDAFLMLLFSFLYGILSSATEDAPGSDATLYLRFFHDFASWGPDRLTKVKGAIESFAEYIIENLILPRMC
jgi:hypothetical protein